MELTGKIRNIYVIACSIDVICNCIVLCFMLFFRKYRRDELLIVMESVMEVMKDHFKLTVAILISFNNLFCCN